MHATEYDRSGENVNTQVYAIERAGMHAADRVIAVSNLTRNIVINRYGVPADKVVTVHNAVRFAAGQCKMPERAWTTRSSRSWGVSPTRKAPTISSRRGQGAEESPNVRFVMAGSGDMMNHVIRRVARLGIADRFHFTGFLRGEDVHKMFQLSDVTSCRRFRSRSAYRPSRQCVRTSGDHLQAERRGRSTRLCREGRLLGCRCPGRCHLRADPVPALAGMFASKGLEEVTNLKWNDAAAKIKTVYEAVIEENKKQ